MKQKLQLVLFTLVSLLGFTSLAQTTFNYTGSMQSYTVPAGVTSIQIEVHGAQGGNNGGLGAVMIGDFAVTPGQQFQILVGQQGQMASNTRAGGGGGTFVADMSNQPVIIAGGGGGRAWDGTGSPTTPGIDANTTEDGNNGYSLENGLGTSWDENYGVGGTAGNGSTLAGPDGFGHAGNGGGFFTDGADGICGLGGDSFLNGGAGGTGCSGGPGGYGGGGNGGNSGGGGGGGYSGGGGSYHNPTSGGGGGSFNSGTNQSNSVSNTGDGLVIITELCDNLTFTPPADTLCQFAGVTLDATSLNGGTITWDNGVMNGVEFFPDTTGWVTYTASSDNGNDCVVSVDIYFEEAPEFTLSSTDELYLNDGTISLFLTNGIFPFTYDWDNDGTGDFDDPQNLSGLSAGTYTVTVMHDNGCSATESIMVNSQVSLNEIEISNLNIYPNPSLNGEFEVNVEGEISSIEVVDMFGRTIELPVSTQTGIVNGQELVAGKYIVRVVTTDDNVLQGTIVVQK